MKQYFKKHKKKFIIAGSMLLLAISVSYSFELTYHNYETQSQQVTDQNKTKEISAVQQAKKTIEETTAKPIKETNAAIGILKIENINLEVALTYGLSSDGNKTFDETNASIIDNKAAIVSGSNLPGENSQIYVAGHNNQSFSALQNLQQGSEITIQTSEKTYTYVFKESKIVDETQVDVINNTLDHEELVLQTCYPFDATNTNQRILFYSYPKK